MLEKIKNIFNNKEKIIENLVSFLIILIITLIVINKILKKDEKEIKDLKNEIGVELAIEDDYQENETDNLEEKLEKILSKINGVGDVAVLITYSESSTLIPIYNISSSFSTIEEKDTSGGTRITETEDEKKDVVTDSGSNIVTEKILTPKVEGAIITAQGAADINVKTNIISAVEAVTGISNHKIQVFEMGG